jgi:hypothetical protein
VYVIGCVPDQVPLSPFSVWPTDGLPEIVGGDEFEGAIVALLVTTAVAAEVAVLDPLVLDAVTATRTVVPRSSMVRV